ncbi:hypothetical protein A0J61_09381 [Choanephora cucurbitarum]|uniref:Uncharacterized protein n=1 Tax=Choanephora cucurbitarum TaxID=101091 RepID=A0A1C7N1R6_9FUNG|nr:hypothetical protein A0J61_09381 [Choanephora cucurbitarum]
MLESLLIKPKPTSHLAQPEEQQDKVNYTLEQLESLTASITLNVNTTIIMQYSTKAKTGHQLDSLLRQTFNPSRIWIVCATEAEKKEATKLIQQKNQAHPIAQTIINTYSEKDWFRTVQQIDSDYVVVLKKGVIPGEGYFSFILRLLQVPSLQQMVLGTESSLRCAGQTANYVQSIEEIWVLRKEWYASWATLDRIVANPSGHLLQQFNLSSLLLPVSDGRTDVKGNRESKGLCSHRDNDAVLLYTDSSATSAFSDFVCSFSEKHEVVYFVTSSQDNKTESIVCKKTTIFGYHVNDTKELEVLLQQLSPRVMLYQGQKYIGYQPETLTLIHLPETLKGLRWMSGLPIDALSEWNTPEIKIIVRTSGNKKQSQMKRILNSIQNANYLNDKVDLFLLMDEKSDRPTSQLINNFKWKHGEKQIRHRIATVHPMQHFVESWYPSYDHEYAVLLDDRLELSPSFYIWLKYSLLKYRYHHDDEVTNKQMIGISAYSPRIIDTDPTGRRLLEPKPSDYLMQLPTGAGALYFPEFWREFHDYITARLTDQSTVKRGSGLRHLFKDSLLTISRTNRWIHSWRKYMDEMIYMRGYVMLYPHQSYSTLHLVQNNLSQKKKEAYSTAEKLYNVPLVSNTDVPQLLPELDTLPVFDLHGKPAELSTLKERGLQLQRNFSACEPAENHDHDPSDMLCPFSQLIQIPVEQSANEIPIKSVNVYL